jgi:esterase/lipase
VPFLVRWVIPKEVISEIQKLSDPTLIQYLSADPLVQSTQSTTLYSNINREYTSASYCKCSRKELIYYMVKKTTS